MAKPTYKTKCPACEAEHTIEPVQGDELEGYENKQCPCGQFLEFYQLGLSEPKAKWVSVEGFETEAKLVLA